MKKLFLTLFAAILTLTAPSVQATSVGDIIGKTLCTDIIASINDYNIASFNFNGSTTVVAEDLQNYGFEVEWRGDERALYITRADTAFVPSTYIAPIVSKSNVGKKLGNIFYTDIKTYINGALAESFNIGGKTIIRFDDLAVFGRISYNDSIRRIDLDVEGLNYKIGAPEVYLTGIPGLGFTKNSADGLNYAFSAKNNTNKDIKYLLQTYYMLNSVGDYEYDEITHMPDFKIRGYGPIYAGSSFCYYDADERPIAYSKMCSYILLDTLEIEYTDGTSEVIYYGYVGGEFTDSANKYL